MLGDMDKATEEKTSSMAQKWQTLKENIKQGWQDLPASIEVVWEQIKEALGLEPILEEINGWLDRIKISFSLIWEDIKKDWEIFWNDLKLILKPITEDILEFLKTWWSNIKLLFGVGLDFIKELWKSTWKIFTDTLRAAWSIITGIVQVAWGVISGIIEVGLAILAKNWTGAWEGIKNSFKNIWEGIKNILRGVWSVIESIFDFSGMIKKWDNFINKVKDWGRDFISNLTSGFREKIDEIKRWGGIVAKALEKFLGFSTPPEEGPLHHIRKWGEELVKTYANSISSGIPYLEKAIGSMTEGVSGIHLAGSAGVAIPTAQAPAPVTQRPSIVKNYNIQPGQMIASRGEIRNFVRMLKQFSDLDNQR